jgi:hypothetical protein
MARRDPFKRSESSTTVAVTDLARAEILRGELTPVELSFDYESIEETHRKRLRDTAVEIKLQLRRTAENIFRVGEALRWAKDVLEHGQFTRWLSEEFGFSERMAQHFMRVHERFGIKSEKFSVLPPSSLYRLAAPSTPDEAVREVEELIDAGERVKLAEVERIVYAARRRTQLALAEPATDREAAGQELERLLHHSLRLLERAEEHWLTLFGEQDNRLEKAQKQVERLRRLTRAQSEAAEATPRPKRRKSDAPAAQIVDSTAVRVE